METVQAPKTDFMAPKTNFMASKALIQIFLDGPSNNSWIPFSHMEVYLRKSVKLHPNTKALIHVVDIANVVVETDWQHKGLFKQFLIDLLEVLQASMMGSHPSRHTYTGVFIENVLNENLATWLRSHKFQEIIVGYDGISSFFIPLKGLTNEGHES